MTLSYDELMSRDLKGFKFCVTRYGMTMTSRHGSIDEHYIVLEDDGENCTVVDLHNRDGYKNVWSKSHTAFKIADNPLLTWNEETKEYNNAIENI